jgi:hypothetical protein
MAKRKSTKGQTMIYKQKNRQYNGQKKKNKRTHNDLQTEGQTIQWPKEKVQKDPSTTRLYLKKTKAAYSSRST